MQLCSESPSSVANIPEKIINRRERLRYTLAAFHLRCQTVDLPQLLWRVCILGTLEEERNAAYIGDFCKKNTDGRWRIDADLLKNFLGTLSKMCIDPNLKIFLRHVGKER